MENHRNYNSRKKHIKVGRKRKRVRVSGIRNVEKKFLLFPEGHLLINLF